MPALAKQRRRPPAALTRMNTDDAMVILRFALGDMSLRGAAEAAHLRNIPLLGVRGSMEQCFMAEELSAEPNVALRKKYRAALLGDPL